MAGWHDARRVLASEREGGANGQDNVCGSLRRFLTANPHVHGALECVSGEPLLTDTTS